jgi:amidase
VGTETQGSIVLPSKVNGVVGLKTSRGLVSGDYVIPLVDWMDTPGPIGRNVTDVAILLTALTASDPANPADDEVSALADTDFTQYLAPDLAQTLRVGILVPSEAVFAQVIAGAASDAGRDLTADEVAAARSVLGGLMGDPKVIAPILNAQGIETVEIDVLAEQGRLAVTDPMLVLEYGFQDSFDAFMAELGDNAPVASLADVVAFNKEDLPNRAPYGQSYVEGSVNTKITAEEYAALKEENMRVGAEALRSLFDEYDVDVILCRSCTQAYAPAGFPALSVPDGYDTAGNPLSVVLIGDYLSEPELISVGHAYEQGAPPRVEPDLDLRMQQIAPVVPGVVRP